MLAAEGSALDAEVRARLGDELMGYEGLDLTQDPLIDCGRLLRCQHCRKPDVASLLDESDKNLSGDSSLARGKECLRFVQSDLRDRDWTKSVGGPFDLAVSAIAIHNLGNPDQMAAVYRGVHEILKPNGVFLDCDYTHTAKLEQHLAWLRDAGFARAESPWQADAMVIMAAFKG